jgi:hypothetical protein
MLISHSSYTPLLVIICFICVFKLLYFVVYMFVQVQTAPMGPGLPRVGRTDGRTVRRPDRWSDGRMVGRTVGRTIGRIDSLYTASRQSLWDHESRCLASHQAS